MQRSLRQCARPRIATAPRPQAGTAAIAAPLWAAVLPWAVILPFCSLKDINALVVVAQAIATGCEVYSGLRLRRSMAAVLSVSIQTALHMVLRCVVWPYFSSRSAGSFLASISMTGDILIHCVRAIANELWRKGETSPRLLYTVDSRRFSFYVESLRFPMMHKSAGVLFCKLHDQVASVRRRNLKGLYDRW